MLLKKISLMAAAGALAITLVACGSSTTPAASSAATSAAMTSAAMSSAMESSAMASGSAAGAKLVGAGCADYAKANASGPASVDGMAAAKVAEAATANPLLKTLVAAVSGKVNPKVNLVDTLDGAEFTVFAPIDSAFASDVDAATLKVLSTDSALLSKILTYHVIAGQIAPDAIAGTHKTVEGQDLTVTGSGDSIKVNGKATVVCGGVKTANATVYLIDHVLMPPADAAMSSAATS